MSFANTLNLPYRPARRISRSAGLEVKSLMIRSDHVEQEPEESRRNRYEAPIEGATLHVGPEQPLSRKRRRQVTAFLHQCSPEAQRAGEQGLHPVRPAEDHR